MKIKVQTFLRKQLLFHSDAVNDPELNGMYTPRSITAVFAWNLWKNSRLIRLFFSSHVKELPIPVDFLKSKFQNFSKWAWVLNMGTTNSEKKITGLFLNHNSRSAPMFLKFSDSPRGIQLVKKEIDILEFVNSKGLKPGLIEHGDYKNAKYFLCEVVKGNKLKSSSMSVNILNCLLHLNSLKPLVYDEHVGLFYSFSHGDFSIWNLLEHDNNITAIDWERSDQRMGYDLFTFIIRTQYAINKRQPVKKLVNENKKWIDLYYAQFNITNWFPYLQNFIQHENQIPYPEKIKEKYEEALTNFNLQEK